MLCYIAQLCVKPELQSAEMAESEMLGVTVMSTAYLTMWVTRRCLEVWVDGESVNSQGKLLKAVKCE